MRRQRSLLVISLAALIVSLYYFNESMLGRLKEKGKEALNKLDDRITHGGQAQQSQSYGQQSQQYMSAPPLQSNMSVPKVNVAYFTNWSIYQRKYHPSKVPVQSLTHILYSFADVKEDGTVFLTDSWSDVEIHYDGDSWNDEGKNLYGNFKQFLRMKQSNRHLKLLLSIGGWTFSPHFAPAMQHPQGRANFVQSAMKILEDVGLDGLDIDWEYPKSPMEAQQYVQLLADLRHALDARSHAFQTRHWLSIAAPCGEQMQMLDVTGMDRYLDLWNLMAYDFSGTWSSRATHQANTFSTNDTDASVDAAIRFYTSRGVATNKLVLGMPLYARAFANTDTLGRPFQGTPEGGVEPGYFLYRNLPLAGHEEHFDEKAHATYSTCPGKREFASYEGPASVDAKCSFILHHNLAGAMWWECSGDADDECGGVDRALIPRAAHRLGSLDQTANCLQYPSSQYGNVQSGQAL